MYITINVASSIELVKLWAYKQNKVRTVWSSEGLGQPDSDLDIIINSVLHPEIDIERKGCVYVGVTKKTVYKRFRQHLEGHKRKGWALHNYPSSRYFKECVEELTEHYGFTHLNVETREKIESWVGYALYKAGYWVWGPHAHEEYKKPKEKNKWEYEDFLGSGDFI